MNKIGTELLGAVTKVTPNGTQAAQATGAGGLRFGEALKNAIDGVNKSQMDAASLQKAYQTEDPNVGLEDAMIAMSKADIQFQALVQVRNRLVSAYHDIMNMPV